MLASMWYFVFVEPTIVVCLEGKSTHMSKRGSSIFVKLYGTGNSHMHKP